MESYASDDEFSSHDDLSELREKIGGSENYCYKQREFDSGKCDSSVVCSIRLGV